MTGNEASAVDHDQTPLVAAYLQLPIRGCGLEQEVSDGDHGGQDRARRRTLPPREVFLGRSEQGAEHGESGNAPHHGEVRILLVHRHERAEPVLGGAGVRGGVSGEHLLPAEGVGHERKGRARWVGRGAYAPDMPADRLADLARLRRVRDRIDREYAEPLDVEALARGGGGGGAHMSAGHLSREFKRAFGESPYSYLMTRRIERAMVLLHATSLPVTEVCFAVGFSSLGTFSTRFAELVGVPPSAYRRGGEGPVDALPPCVGKQVRRLVRNREADEVAES
ncbi:hypothetical protein GCM10028815_29410 [Mariniluteicoccus flavus]